MKKLAKKSAKPTIADMTPKQFEAALVRHGIEHDLSFTHSGDYFVIAGNGGVLAMGKTRRAKLANLLNLKDGFESEQEAPASDPYQIADTAIGKQIIDAFSPAGDAALAKSIELDNAHTEAGDTYEDPVWGTVTVPAEDAPVSEAEATFEAEAADGVIKKNDEYRSEAEIADQSVRNFTSAAISEMFDSLEARLGLEAATKMLFTASQNEFPLWNQNETDFKKRY
jgi:hypothetical protein